MDKAKPIEPGCLAVATRSQCPMIIPFKTILKIKRRMSEGEIYMGDYVPDDRYWLFTTVPNGEGSGREDYLMRIDDPDNQAYIESTDKLEKRKNAKL